MSVELVRKVRLLVGAGAAKPGPAIGQALGPLGLNMADFCKQFNEVTKTYEKDVPIPVELSAMSNRSFTFKVKTPPTSFLVKKCAKVTVFALVAKILKYAIKILCKDKFQFLINNYKLHIDCSIAPRT